MDDLDRDLDYVLVHDLNDLMVDYIHYLLVDHLDRDLSELYPAQMGAACI